MNELNDLLTRRLRGMGVRILSCIEHTIRNDLDAVGDNEKFQLRGSDLKIIRSEILNSVGDTTRSLATALEQPIVPNRRSVSREMIAALNGATFQIVDFEDDDSVPIFKMEGDFAVLRKIRDEVKAGIVYKTTYTCAGIEDVINSVIPFLDVMSLAGIKLGNGDYKAWRDEVCKLYLEGLE